MFLQSEQAKKAITRIETWINNNYDLQQLEEFEVRKVGLTNAFSDYDNIQFENLV